MRCRRLSCSSDGREVKNSRQSSLGPKRWLTSDAVTYSWTGQDGGRHVVVVNYGGNQGHVDCNSSPSRNFTASECI